MRRYISFLSHFFGRPLPLCFSFSLSTKTVFFHRYSSNDLEISFTASAATLITSSSSLSVIQKSQYRFCEKLSVGLKHFRKSFHKNVSLRMSVVAFCKSERESLFLCSFINIFGHSLRN